MIDQHDVNLINLAKFIHENVGLTLTSIATKDIESGIFSN